MDNRNKGDDDNTRMGFLDVAAFIIAAFQILIPYMLFFLLTLLLVPVLLYLLMKVLGR